MNSILNFLVFGGAGFVIVLILNVGVTIIIFHLVGWTFDKKAMRILMWFSILFGVYEGTLAAINQYHHFV